VCRPCLRRTQGLAKKEDARRQRPPAAGNRAPAAPPAARVTLHAQWQALAGFDDPHLDALWADMIHQAGAASARGPAPLRDQLAALLDQADVVAKGRDREAFGALLAQLDAVVAAPPGDV
jgi:hypothetical protein